MDCSPRPHPYATVGSGKGGDYAYFNANNAIGHAWGRYLPHWRQPGAVYFVTFRTSDSIPAKVIEQWQHEREAWLREHPEPHDDATVRDYHQRFTERMHRFLDDCQGACVFKDEAARQIVTETLLKKDGEDYALDDYVIMPNHVHVLVAPMGDTTLSKVLLTWKRVTTHRVNRLAVRSGALWQEEHWDHIVRSVEHLARYRRYIRANPNRLPNA